MTPLQCPNCDTVVTDVFCGHCGQRRGDLHHPLKELAGELLEEFIHWDSRILRTLKPLFLKPGLVTLEYWRGRRASHARPLQLYLVATFLFFAGMGLGLGKSQVRIFNVTGDDSPSEKVKPLAPNASRWERLQYRFETTGDTKEGLAQIQRDVTTAVVEDMPKAMFLLLPVAALLLQLFYRRQGRFYAEHFIFALHLHAFFFFVMALTLPLPSAVASLLQLALLPYLFMALRRVFEQGRLKTAFKTLGLVLLYFTAVFTVSGMVVFARLLATS